MGSHSLMRFIPLPQSRHGLAMYDRGSIISSHSADTKSGCDNAVMEGTILTFHTTTQGGSVKMCSSGKRLSYDILSLCFADSRGVYAQFQWKLVLTILVCGVSCSTI